MLIEPNTSLLDTNTGQRLMRLTFQKEQIQPLRDLTRVLLDLVDVRAFVHERLPGARITG
ncbi:hypothetical protein GCM10008955_42250 [Deinococcus malanensis]|uniref:Transposase DDE domain-containing protein n=1 Tax=Deinococcus malanensis TaxID=1706855 RepID=A0ABQ2F2Y5_9DEIO|nr:hypothetical protein GCM10008955_42250 [Deinococcus malanensis]